MTDIVIKAENIGEKYIIGHQAERGDYTFCKGHTTADHIN